MTLPNGVSSNQNSTGSTPHTVTITTLTSMVVGTMVSAGVFSLPSNFAAEAGVVGSLIAWVIAGAGMLMVTLVFQKTALRRPDLEAGMYSYAKAGFGRYAGFMAAFGYWASSVIGNVTYWVLIMSTLSIAFPHLGAGDTTLAAICSIIGVWFFHMLIARGVREAAIVNKIVTIAKLLPIILFVIVALAVADLDLFRINLWGSPEASLFSQVKDTMMITLFVLLGVEGATIFSRYARKRSDIGRATIGGFLGVLTLFALVSLVGFGSLTQSDIAALKQPSVATVFAEIVGPWGAIFMSAALILSVLGAYLSWTLMAAEVLYAAASHNDMPRYMKKVNKHGTPINALATSSISASIFVLVARFSQDAFNFSLVMTGTMALVPYLLATTYALKLAIADKHGSAVRLGLAPFSAADAENQLGFISMDSKTSLASTASEEVGSDAPAIPADSSANTPHFERAKSYEACSEEPGSRSAEAGGSAWTPSMSNRGARNIAIAALALLFSCALIFAAGYEALLFACVLYVPGTILYVMTRKENNEPVFTRREKPVFLVVLGFAILAIALLVTGQMAV